MSILVIRKRNLKRLRPGRTRGTKPTAKGEKADELRPEYNLGKLLKGGIQGKYTDRYQEGTNLVLLTPDVAKAFRTDEAVNEAIRLVIRLRNLPGAGKKTAAKA